MHSCAINRTEHERNYSILAEPTRNCPNPIRFQRVTSVKPGLVIYAKKLARTPQETVWFTELSPTAIISDFLSLASCCLRILFPRAPLPVHFDEWSLAVHYYSRTKAQAAGNPVVCYMPWFNMWPAKCYNRADMRLELCSHWLGIHLYGHIKHIAGQTDVTQMYKVIKFLGIQSQKELDLD